MRKSDKTHKNNWFKFQWPKGTLQRIPTENQKQKNRLQHQVCSIQQLASKKSTRNLPQPLKTSWTNQRYILPKEKCRFLKNLQFNCSKRGRFLMKRCLRRRIHSKTSGKRSKNSRTSKSDNCWMTCNSRDNKDNDNTR